MCTYIRKNISTLWSLFIQTAFKEFLALTNYDIFPFWLFAIGPFASETFCLNLISFLYLKSNKNISLVFWPSRVKKWINNCKCFGQFCLSTKIDFVLQVIRRFAKLTRIDVFITSYLFHSMPRVDVINKSEDTHLRGSFTGLVKSKSEKQLVGHVVILPPWVSVLWLSFSIEIKLSYWLKLVTWLTTTKQIAFFIVA